MQTNKLKIITKDTEMKFGILLFIDIPALMIILYENSLWAVIIDVQNTDTNTLLPCSYGVRIDFKFHQTLHTHPTDIHRNPYFGTSDSRCL